MSSARVDIPRTVVEALHEHITALCWKSDSRYVPKITRTRVGAIIPTSYSVLLCYFSACLMFVSFSYTNLLMLLGPSDVPRGQVGKSAVCRSGVCWADIPPGLRGCRRRLTWREKGAMVLRLKSWRAGHKWMQFSGGLESHKQGLGTVQRRLSNEDSQKDIVGGYS
ncbi:hypothetical protein QYE76_005351 [Lolium multiflorum]|uniref:Uncharacterized protein n=1 Tax=Lolium multiflorum TaxID=4521 RepID=A0AAD8W3B5_LOLMU|nr:hypothetical protein QYE76_005351 [Lolium multiflorum]